MELPEATIVRLRTQHLTLGNLIDDLSEEELNQAIVLGKWTIKQQIAHLVRYQDMFHEHLQIIMSSFNAVFSSYVAEEDEHFAEICNLSMPQLRKNLEEKREIINSFYLHLNSGELNRKGRHTQLGYFSIALWGEFFLLHEAHHLYSIFLLRNQLKQQPVDI